MPPLGGVSYWSLHGSALGSLLHEAQRGQTQGTRLRLDINPGLRSLLSCLSASVLPSVAVPDPTRHPGSFCTVCLTPLGLVTLCVHRPLGSALSPSESQLPVTAPVNSQSSRQLRSFSLSPPYGKGETKPRLSIFWKLQHHLFLSSLISGPSLQPSRCHPRGTWCVRFLPSPSFHLLKIRGPPSPKEPLYPPAVWPLTCTSCPSSPFSTCPLPAHRSCCPQMQTQS